MLALPTPLVQPFVVAGEVVLKIVVDLTVYLVGPTDRQLDELCALYERFCPPQRRVAYLTDELVAWTDIAVPELTQSGRVAAAAGVPRPYLEPSRNRLRQARAVAVSFWDRREPGDPEDSWSFSLRQIKRRSTGLHAFVRFLLPLATEPALLWEMAKALADTVPFRSGHGGLAFGYDPAERGPASDETFARARRYWGVDVEDLDTTLPLMNDRIKGVSWMTLVGNELAVGVEGNLRPLVADGTVQVESRRHGQLIRIGEHPIAGDRNKPDGSLDPYFRLAGALEPLYLDHCPDFYGERFQSTGKTTGWIRRFLEPAGW
jgi:hypothetical protein